MIPADRMSFISFGISGSASRWLGVHRSEVTAYNVPNRLLRHVVPSFYVGFSSVLSVAPSSFSFPDVSPDVSADIHILVSLFYEVLAHIFPAAWINSVNPFSVETIITTPTQA
jgi:hypothetical protein